MRVRKQDLSFWITVRRSGYGSKPFRWELRSAETAEPLQLSPETFSSMDSAFRAGQSILSVFLESPHAR